MSEREDIKNQETTETVEDQPTVEEQSNTETEESNELSEMDVLKKSLDEAKDQNLRLYAEFENFRKRTNKERVELFSTANQELMTALLPILDDFNRAIKAEKDDKATEGMKLIHNKFENTLKSKGLKPMDDTIGQDFDPDQMEAVTQIPAPDKKLKGKVVDEIERGYLLGSKILRYAKVAVGQ
jgi:molecular chaperone GrpE